MSILNAMQAGVSGLKANATAVVSDAIGKGNIQVVRSRPGLSGDVQNH